MARVSDTNDDTREGERDDVSMISDRDLMMANSAQLRAELGRRLKGPHWLDSTIVIVMCCDRPMRMGGHFSLRGAGGNEVTSLALDCERCGRKATIVDDQPRPSPEMLRLLDGDPACSVAQDHDDGLSVSREDMLTRALGIALDYAPQNPTGDAEGALALARRTFEAAKSGKLNSLAEAATAELDLDHIRDTRGPRA